MEQKIIFITGASSGIGKETVKYFHKKGWRVAASMRVPEQCDELRSLNGVRLYRMDVTKPDEVKSVVAQVWQEMGPVDLLVNNAGYGAIGPLEYASNEQVRRQFDVNVIGLLQVTRAFLPLFRKQGTGMIINLSSIAGRMALPLYSLYHGTKYAVEGITESLYYELRQWGIQVKLVEPGPVKTDFNGRSKDTLANGGVGGYDDFAHKVYRFYDKNFDYGISAHQVAKTIYRAACSQPRKLRFAAGFPAQTLLFMKRIMPAVLFRTVTRSLMRI
ncbi:SDR family oxidoreductase [Marinilabiliaceae bacterium JC017]|nr:SDR family oxidoreductase [Marinilabiliaceae bacterium JC017]